jgi:hypothetical protein
MLRSRATSPVRQFAHGVDAIGAAFFAAIAGSACGMASAVAPDVDLVLRTTRITDLVKL